MYIAYYLTNDIYIWIAIKKYQLSIEHIKKKPKKHAFEKKNQLNSRLCPLNKKKSKAYLIDNKEY